MSKVSWTCLNCHKSKSEQEVEANNWQWPICCDEPMMIGVVIGKLESKALNQAADERKCLKK